MGGKPSHLEWEIVQEVSTDVVIETDASKTGLGSLLLGNPDRRLLECSGSRTTHQFLGNVSSILCIQSLHQGLSGISVLLRTDNMSVVTYVNRMVGTRSSLLTAQAIDLWSWCLLRKITVAALYKSRTGECYDRLPAKAPKRQDRLGVRTHHFNCVNSQLGPLQVGLFATCFSKQLPRFFSSRPDPEAEATDAFAQSWTSIQGFAHSPWCLISRVLWKVQANQAIVVHFGTCSHGFQS